EGIARSRVILEERSRSTHENAVYTKEMVRPASGETWILVTSAYHMPRAVACFEAVGWPVIPYPVDFRIDPETGLRANFSLLDGLATSTLAGKEWAGLVGYRLMGWTQELFPGPQGHPNAERLDEPRLEPFQRAHRGKYAPGDEQSHPAPIDV